MWDITNYSHDNRRNQRQRRLIFLCRLGPNQSRNLCRGGHQKGNGAKTLDPEEQSRLLELRSRRAAEIKVCSHPFRYFQPFPQIYIVYIYLFKYIYNKMFFIVGKTGVPGVCAEGQAVENSPDKVSRTSVWCNGHVGGTPESCPWWRGPVLVHLHQLQRNGHRPGKALLSPETC